VCASDKGAIGDANELAEAANFPYVVRLLRMAKLEVIQIKGRRDRATVSSGRTVTLRGMKTRQAETDMGDWASQGREVNPPYHPAAN
jgi:hypothetical protein